MKRPLHLRLLRTIDWVALALTLTAAPAARAGFGDCGRFLRGDSNVDGGVDLSDGIATLLSLFSAGVSPACRDAADADDSGGINVTDALYTFQYLFLGGFPPPSPGPFECGADDTQDPLGCTDSSACVSGPVSTDFSGFERFEWEQRPALGFCPELHQVFHASIRKQDGGAYLLEMSVLEEGRRGVDECLEDFVSVEPDACAAPVPLAPRLLSGGEVEAALRLFSAVEVHSDEDPICHCVAFDPCLVWEFRWDDRAATDFLCSAPHIGFGQGQAIVAFLEGLRPVQ